MSILLYSSLSVYNTPQQEQGSLKNPQLVIDGETNRLKDAGPL